MRACLRWSGGKLRATGRHVQGENACHMVVTLLVQTAPVIDVQMVGLAC
jgi:hypothetical protein